MKKYEELPDEWSRIIHAEVRRGGPVEDLVFIEQADGSLRPFGPNAPNLGREEGHCTIVRSVGKRPNGETYATCSYARSFDGVLRMTPGVTS